MNNKRKKTIVISSLCFVLCFLSGIFMILVSNQDKFVDPLEIICFSFALSFGLIGLGQLLLLLPYLNQNENNKRILKTDKKIEGDLKYAHKSLKKILKGRYKNEQQKKNNK